jgi:hypothetical protein
LPGALSNFGPEGGTSDVAAVATLAAVAVQVSLALENISAQYAGFEGRSEMQGKVQMSLSNGQLTCHNLGDKRSEKRMNRVCQQKTRSSGW